MSRPGLLPSFLPWIVQYISMLTHATPAQVRYMF